MKRSQQGRGVFYTRDSGGEHETTPSEYVKWAQRRADELGVAFGPTPNQIEEMIRTGRHNDGDLFLDYRVKGNRLRRPGLDALFKAIKSDLGISHIFIPMRQRLARPDDPLDAMKMEDQLRTAGITLVFMDLKLDPILHGKRDIGERIVAMLDYHRAGDDRRDLATKMIYAQLSLAKDGYSTGGRPPFGFRRWLVNADAKPARELAEGEYVKMAGHHVVWLPGPETELALIRRILCMLETMPASRVAAILTAENIPTPNAGRIRRDRGVKHFTSGVWHQQTIVNIARHPLLLAVVEHGRRSMGDKLRFSADGPRELCETDNRADGKPKVVVNPESARIKATARFSPLVEPARHHRLLQELDRRGGTQRGKSRSRDPFQNPLGGRVIDMNCTWPMYRQPYCSSFRYTCGLYQQSHGGKCTHNHVDGPTATRFGLSVLRQRIFSARILEKLRGRLRQLAELEVADAALNKELAGKKLALAGLQAEVTRTGENMALAASPDQYKFLSDIFEQKSTNMRKIEVEISQLENRALMPSNVTGEVDAAISVLDWLPDLAADADNFRAIGEAFNLVNLRMFLRFEPIQVGKRVVNKLVCGSLNFGAAPTPVTIYDGPTARRQIKSKQAATVAAGPIGKTDEVGDPGSNVSGVEGNSLGNVNRGDRI